MNFTEFSYSRQMEAILTIVAIGSTIMLFYLVVKILLKIYDENVSLMRKVLFIIPACIFYTVTIYGTYALYGFKSIPNVILLIITLPSPILAALCYFLGIKALKLSNVKSINVVRQSFFYMLVTININAFIRRTFFHFRLPYNYFIDAISLLLCDIIYILFYFLIVSYVNKNGIIIRINDSIKIKNWKFEIVTSFLIIILVYLVIVYIIIINKLQGFEPIVVVIGLLLLLLTDINLGYNRALKNEFIIKDSYINSLSNSIDSFNTLNKEFKDALDSYDTYIKDDNLEALKSYHESLIKKTMLTNEKIELTKKMSQNPLLVSTLLKKLEYASSCNVLFFMPVLCSLENMYIDDLDLSIVLSNLLDNAIEAAAISLQRRVSFSIKEKDAECKTIIISNSTKDDVDIDKITLQRISTKEGHNGLGIIQVRNILRKYWNCSLHFNYYKNEFSVYVELWM